MEHEERCLPLHQLNTMNVDEIACLVRSLGLVYYIAGVSCTRLARDAEQDMAPSWASICDAGSTLRHRPAIRASCPIQTDKWRASLGSFWTVAKLKLGDHLVSGTVYSAPRQLIPPSGWTDWWGRCRSVSVKCWPARYVAWLVRRFTYWSTAWTCFF